MSIAARTRIGPYEVTTAIGAGGMGEVYRARDTRLNRDVALKILPDIFASDPERLARFEREAQVLASLNHPHIAQIFGIEEGPPQGGYDSNLGRGASDAGVGIGTDIDAGAGTNIDVGAGTNIDVGAAFRRPVRALVMEFVDGETLADRIARAAIPIDEALPIARQIAEALEAAHEQGIIHRDLKPANIKLRADGTVKVLDFGLAKLVQPAATAAANAASLSPTITSPALMTGVGMLLGTAAYMSPEQAKGREADQRSDIWAFGCVLYEMLTGRPPFPGQTTAETLSSVLRDEPSLHDVPASVRTLVARCIDKNPRQRLQAIGEGRIALERPARFVADSPSSGTNRRGLWVAWTAAALCLVSAVVVLLLYFGRQATPPTALRYTITAPAGSTLQSFAMSPDGRHLAIAASLGGMRQIWLRTLDDFQLRPLPNTEGGSFPFWSPDARQIGFFADGKLKKISIAGGLAQTLCNVADGRAGAWNGDGVILFAGSTALIQRVAANGGTPTDVIKTAAGGIRNIAFLPGGDFLYTVSFDTRGGEIHLGSLARPETRRVIPEAGFAIFSASAGDRRTGHLLFVRDDTLMAQAFDARAGQVSGEAIPIAAGVSIPARGPYTPVTGSETGVVVYARTEQTEGTSQLLWVERSGKSIDSAIGAGSSPSLSPDGRFVAYVRNPNVRSEVWVRDLASGREVRLTADESRTTTPLWAPTSDRLLFRSERGPKPGDLYQRASSGAGRDELLIATANNKIPDQWSRDGRYIVYVESRGTTAAGWRLWTLPVSQGPPLRVDGKPMLFLADGSGETQGQLSPDGRWMAYVSPEGGREEVYVRPFPAAGDSRWKVSAEGGVQPRWRADGKELYFVAIDRRMMAATIQTAASRATASAASVLDVGVPVPLFETHLVGGVASRAYQYDVTPDGKHFLVATTSPLTAPVLSVEVNWSARMADH